MYIKVEHLTVNWRNAPPCLGSVPAVRCASPKAHTVCYTYDM